MQQKDIPSGIINPFSDNFLQTWDLWKMWRWSYDKFKYKGVISEQMALKLLVDLSSGEEEKAIRIVEQSIGKQWTGFYGLKSSHGKSGKTNSDVKADLRSRVQSAVSAKFGGGEQEGGGSNLKAV